MVWKSLLGSSYPTVLGRLSVDVPEAPEPPEPQGEATSLAQAENHGTPLDVA